ncbi:UDP-2,4-diacetamido-2,4,6-trideoxy-beta-L-altropyranose hydrolase [Nitrosopumilus sp. b1]|uniref:UDP-2,4-diacetamido-2,4, 6-trideoxy-beta-L-altropyranose hydrolase n=1 Tax=Nitrosopumilus sp. b1 TaxID=2109907 RepID=UPI0015F52E30|nr:UDP-2,4-diacetamido-2,4,6-trideoxy-beta-L-altropyranose hydrolase [Nitrosopumilus sp. b1]KAF6244002.1 UDP-2,4-diacetamido-2,4,6-trideoxy-beta-L-altropyranose hydrolase [Nitrosopumilus sp. b1]
MKTQVCCRCLTENKTGYGNFNRCLTLAKQLKRKKIDIIFLIDKNKKIINKLKASSFSYCLIPDKYSKINEHQFILKFLNQKNLHSIIIDMRQFGEKLSKILHENDKRVILIDDVWSKNIYSDIFFNSTNVVNLDKYKIKNKSCQIYSGLKYYPINKNFLKYRKRFTDITDKDILTLVISMGGSDPNNLTYNLLKIIKDFNQIKINVILGPLYKNFKNLKSMIKNSDNVCLIQTPKNIFKELSKGDVAITNGGNTLFEIIALRIPSIVIPSFKHEVFYAKNFSKNKCIINLGFQQKNKKVVYNALNKIIKNTKVRKDLHRSTSNLIDGNGLERMSKIISYFLQ